MDSPLLDGLADSTRWKPGRKKIVLSSKSRYIITVINRVVNHAEKVNLAIGTRIDTLFSGSN